MAPFRRFVRPLLLFSGMAVLACQESLIVEPDLGTIQITTATTGVEPDEDGYTVQVDAEPSQVIGLAATLHAHDVTGHHSVQLSGVAANCAVQGQNPRPADITANDTTRVVFVVICSSTAGSILVVSSTTGSFPDPDGYRITVDGGTRGLVEAIGKQTVTGVAAGEHQVSLDSVASNCAVVGSPTAISTVVTGGTDTVGFTIDCSASPPIAFGNGHIMLVNPDGSGLKNLTPQDAYLSQPVWSPDGKKIAFGKEFDLWVINSDGTGRSQLTVARRASFAVNSYNARWSPDGTRIAFVRDTIALTPEGTPDDSCDGVCLISQVWIMAADGSGARRLATGSAPSWSAHGQRIAFQCGSSTGPGQICVINADGSAQTQVTNFSQDAGDAQWSPAGERIAFVAYHGPSPGIRDIFLVDPDGSHLVNVTKGKGDYASPRWSPDGTRIAFTLYNGIHNTAIGVMSPDGTGETILTRDAAYDEDLHWSPDGRALLFARFADEGSDPTGAYVITNDGSHQTNVSHGFASGLSWSPRH